MTRFVLHYGLPESTISDQGQNFKSALITEFCKLAKIWKLCTSPYHPQTNGQCEQVNHMLGTLPPKKNVQLEKHGIDASECV